MLGANYFGETYFGDADASGFPIVPMPAEIVAEAQLAGTDWTALTEDLTDAVVDITRGYQSDRPDDLVAAPAVCSFGLRNDVSNSVGTRSYYSPDHGSVRSGWAESVPIRVRLRAGTTLRTRFIGFVQAIRPKLGIYDEQTVAVTCTSWLQLAAVTPVKGVTAQVNQRGDQLATTIAALTPFPPPALAFGVGVDTYPYALDDLDPTQNTVVDGFDSATKSGLDRLHELADGTLVWEPRLTRLLAPARSVALADVAPAGLTSFALIGGELARDLAAIYRRATLTGHPRAVDASPVVLYSYPLSVSTPSIAAGDTVVVQGQYTDPNQQAQQVGGFNMLIKSGGGSVIGTAGDLPTADFSFTSAPNGGGADVSGSMTVTVVFDVRQPTFTITNGSGATAYYAKLQCRGQGIYNYAQAIGRAANTTQAAALSAQTVSFDCPYQTDPNFLQSVAQYIVAAYGGGLARFTQGAPLEIPATDVATLDAALALDISDALSVSEQMSGIGNFLFWINGVHEQYDERGNLTLAWSLARCVFSDAWTLGLGLLDSTAKLG